MKGRKDPYFPGITKVMDAPSFLESGEEVCHWGVGKIVGAQFADLGDTRVIFQFSCQQATPA